MYSSMYNLYNKTKKNVHHCTSIVGYNMYGIEKTDEMMQNTILLTQ